MLNENEADLLSVVDEDGQQHEFEILDRIETDDGRFVALIPYHDNPADSLDDDGELIILQVAEENGEDMLVPIEDDALFDEIADIFEERLSEEYDVQSDEEGDTI